MLLTRFSDTRSCTALGAAVRPVRASDGAFPVGTIKPEGMHKERSQKRIGHRAGSGGVHNLASSARR